MEKLYFKTIDSTNLKAKEIIKQNLNKGKNFAVISDRQTSGKGKLGRSFFSPADTGLYISAVLKIKNCLSLNYMTKAAAVAVCRAFSSCLDIDLNIKPINDLIYNKRKAGGILVESFLNYLNEGCWVIFGIGINLIKPKGGFPEDISDKATYIFDDNTEKIDKFNITNQILVEILKISKDFSDPGIIHEYRRRKTIEKLY